MLFGVQPWCFSSIPRVDSPKNLIWCHVHGCHFQKRPNFKVEDPPIVMVPGYGSKHVKTRPAGHSCHLVSRNPYRKEGWTMLKLFHTFFIKRFCSENEAQFSQSHCILRLGVEYDITICPTHFSYPCPIISPFRSRSQDCQKMHCYEHPEHSECRGLCRRQAEMKNVERVQCLDQMGSEDDRDFSGGKWWNIYDGTYWQGFRILELFGRIWNMSSQTWTDSFRHFSSCLGLRICYRSLKGGHIHGGKLCTLRSRVPQLRLGNKSDSEKT